MDTRLPLDRLEHRTTRAAKLRGAYLAVVTSNSDGGGDSRYRVKVKFPWLNDGEESQWARIAVPMAGDGRGTYFLPEVDDQVIVVFEHGDVRRPIVIGALWSNRQPPPERNGNGDNDIRVIKSKSGHRLIFDDTGGRERVILVDSTRKNKVVLDAADDSVTIESGEGDVEIKAPIGAVRLHGDSVKLTASSSISAKGVAKVEVQGGSALTFKAGAMLQLAAADFKMGPG